MKLLVISKTPTYDYYSSLGDRYLKNYIDGNKGLGLRDSKSVHSANFSALKGFLDSEGHDVSYFYRGNKALDDIDTRDYAYIIAFGGDGTVLESARYDVHGETPIIGINSDTVRSVGNYCGYTTNSFIETFYDMRNHSLSYLDRVSAEIEGRPVPFYALNEVLMSHEHPAKGIKCSIEQSNGNNVVYRHFCSGVWISTVSGSTGAIKNAGGDSMNHSGWMQYLVRESSEDSENCYGHLRESETLSITTKHRGVSLYFDGAHAGISLEIGDTVKFGLTKNKAMVMSYSGAGSK